MVSLRRLAGSLATVGGSLDSSVLEAFEPDRGGQEHSFLVYANAERAYWLLPTDAAARRAALGLYSPQTFLGRVLRANMRRGWFSMRRIGLAKGRVEDFCHRVSGTIGQEQLRLAFSVGPPRPTQKLTAVLIDRLGREVAYAKIAFGKAAREALSRERAVLAGLASEPYLSARVPSVLGWFRWGGGDVLVLSPGPRRGGGGTLGADHAEFLRCLHESTVHVAPFDSSEIRRRLSVKHERLGGFLSLAWQSRYERALDRLDRVLQETEVPTSLAHRDFTPWNTRRDEAGLFVFDWETAEPGATPAYDAFHFRAIQAALMGRPVALDDWIPGFISSVWPEGLTLLPDLWLTYLVDMSMVYAEAHVVSSGIGDHRVLEWFGEEIGRHLNGDDPRSQGARRRTH